MYINYVYVHFCANSVVDIVLGGVIIIVIIVPCRVMLETIEGLSLLVRSSTVETDDLSSCVGSGP